MAGGICRGGELRAYYNENDPRAAEWLRQLIAQGLIPDGDVDDRSIEEIQPRDVLGYVQCHWFSGIGGWPLALRMAGWPDSRPVWTGSCPCQRFSSAARGRNVADDLWPVWSELIAARKPGVVFGEQVAKGEWIDRACDDLETMDYEVGAAVLPAISVGYDHIRHRVYFVGDSHRDGKSGVPVNGEVARVSWDCRELEGVVSPDGVSDEMALMRGFGNAIVPEVAAEFVMAYMGAS